jgi:phage FluMu protein Com
LEFREYWSTDLNEILSTLIDLYRVKKLRLTCYFGSDCPSDIIYQTKKLFDYAKNVSVLHLHIKCPSQKMIDQNYIPSILPYHVKHLRISSQTLIDMKILDQLKHILSVEFAWPHYFDMLPGWKPDWCRGVIQKLKMNKRKFRYREEIFGLQVWLGSYRTEKAVRPIQTYQFNFDTYT